MRDRLRELGFTQVETIGEDLGRSAFGSAERSGFSRMVAQVCLGKVGAVAAREVPRFARNSRDWQQLIEMCRVVDTVLVDQEAVCSPRQGNDRLLLGLLCAVRHKRPSTMEASASAVLASESFLHSPGTSGPYWCPAGGRLVHRLPRNARPPRPAAAPAIRVTGRTTLCPFLRH